MHSLTGILTLLICFSLFLLLLLWLLLVNVFSKFYHFIIKKSCHGTNISGYKSSYSLWYSLHNIFHIRYYLRSVCNEFQSVDEHPSPQSFEMLQPLSPYHFALLMYIFNIHPIERGFNIQVVVTAVVMVKHVSDSEGCCHRLVFLQSYDISVI